MTNSKKGHRTVRQIFQNTLANKPKVVWADEIQVLQTTDIMKSWLASICWWHYPCNCKYENESPKLVTMMDDYRSDWNEHNNEELKVFFKELAWPYNEISNDSASPKAHRERYGMNEDTRITHPEAQTYRSYHKMIEKQKKGFRKYG